MIDEAAVIQTERMIEMWEAIPHYPYGEVPDKIVEDENSLGLYRCIVVKRALLAGYGDDDIDPEFLLSDILTDLRHLCGALGLDFAECDKRAYRHYTEEKEGAQV